MARTHLDLADALNRTGKRQEAAQQGRQTIARIDQWTEENDARNVAAEELIRLRAELEALVRQIETAAIAPAAQEE